MGSHRRTPAAGMVVACALSLSLGWGIRGNFGHGCGAMIPGALAALAAVLLSGREDWWRRAVYFGLFGALGWSFGGTISYMHVIAYTHSGHLPSQVYGFACLFVIGFLWAALGGAGTALPACLDGGRLTELFPPVLAVLGAWLVGDLVLPVMTAAGHGAARHESWLYWYDTDWVEALLALAAVLLLALVRRRWSWASSFVLHLAVGWWAAFLLMVLMVDGLGVNVRMTPPRGDNWAGVLGMTAGLFIYTLRHGLAPVARAALVAGCWGGFGFAAATFLKLAEVKHVPLGLSRLFGPGEWDTNWHSVLEQTYGLINGVGIAAAMAPLARRQPAAADEPPARPWTGVIALVFVLLVIPYLNLVKIVPTWVQQHAVPARLYGLPSRLWFEACGVAILLAAMVLMMRHRRRPLALVPPSALGRAQLLYLALLWSMVLGNWLRAIPPFAEQRLITEGVIHVNAVLCSLLVLLGPRPLALPDRAGPGLSLRGVTAVGLVVFAGTVALASWGVRVMHGDTALRKYTGYHVRFGPDARPGKPEKGKPHP